MPLPRRMLSLTPSEAAAMRSYADELGATASSVGRAWIADFLENGSTFQKEEEVRIQIFADRDDIDRAEAKARAEYGVSLSEILKHYISLTRE